MTESLPAASLLLALSVTMSPGHAGLQQAASRVTADTVHVAAPTGDKAADRARIVAAFERARPGDTIQFAPGLYLVGEIVPVSTRRLTVLGHPEGTTLRGCDPFEMEPREREMLRALQSADTARAAAAVRSCGMFELTGGRATVRNLVFEYTRLGVVIRCCELESVIRPDEGGYRIEGNTFRNSANGVRADVAASEPTVIRGNRFVNVFHAVSAGASHLHVLENEISAPEPERVSPEGHPSFAIVIGGARSAAGTPATAAGFCQHNVVAGNRIEGHPDGILIIAGPGTSCRDNVIRGNTIAARRVRLPAERIVPNAVTVTDESDSTIVGVPLALENLPRGPGQPGDPSATGSFEGNLIEGNRLTGANGVAIIVNRASRNRIVNNTISGVTRRDPFPGNTLAFPPARWRDANGAGIWVSPGSGENEIAGNTFSDVASAAVVLEGNRNRVVTRSTRDVVRDLGTDNRVSVRDTALRASPPDTIETGYLVVHAILLPVGEEAWAITREADEVVLHAEHNRGDRGRTSGSSAVLRLGPDLRPRAFRLRATDDGDVTETVVEVNGPHATVLTSSGSERTAAPDRFFTLSGLAPHALHMMLVRYWLDSGRPDSIPILPRGRATISHMGRDTLVNAGERVVLDRYHVSGTALGGATLWLDDRDRLIAASRSHSGHRQCATASRNTSRGSPSGPGAMRWRAARRRTARSWRFGPARSRWWAAC